MANKKSYVYKVTKLSTGEYYYGYRTIAASKDPIDDIGVKYFTSSKVVKHEFMSNPSGFAIEIVEVFDDKGAAFIYENRTIEMFIKDPMCLNKTYDRGAVRGVVKNMRIPMKINGRFMTTAERREVRRKLRAEKLLTAKQAHWERMKKKCEQYIDPDTGATVYVIK